MSKKPALSSDTVRLGFQKGRYVATAVDEAAAVWLSFYAQRHPAYGRRGGSIEIDPRFISEFRDAADAASIRVNGQA